jgi:hypothetical protein
MKRFDQNFYTANIIDRKKDWIDYRQECVSTYAKGKTDRIRIANNLNRVDWNNYNLNDYIFTHNTIVASVAHDEMDSHTITEASVPTINANENAWLSEVLGPPTNIYRSFVGAENFYEHVQDFRLSKGKVLDAVLRKVKNAGGEKVWYVDILVATHRKHRDLVARIAKKELNTLSMGCLANLTQCSKCGKVMHNDWDACNHIRYEIGQPYKTDYGYMSKVAELCGYQGDPQSCRFIEASWVEAPAFKGAVVNHYVSVPTIKEFVENNVIDFDQASKALRSISAGDIGTLKKVRVADRHSMTALRLFIEGLKDSHRFHRIRKIAKDL